MPLLTCTPLIIDNPLQLYRIELAPPKEDLTQGQAQKYQQKKFGKTLLCSTCSAVITEQRHAFSINGGHEHTFFNPAGIAFEVRCFLLAPGCLVQGKASTDFSWFDGYRWQYATCGNCLTHLGWFFIARKHSFFSLICNKLLQSRP